MKLGYLAVPKYITSGKHDFKGVEYRFMVMERFGVDVEKHFRACPGGRFSDDTVSYLALRLVGSPLTVESLSEGGGISICREQLVGINWSELLAWQNFKNVRPL